MITLQSTREIVPGGSNQSVLAGEVLDHGFICRLLCVWTAFFGVLESSLKILDDGILGLDLILQSLLGVLFFDDGLGLSLLIGVISIGSGPFLERCYIFHQSIFR